MTELRGLDVCREFLEDFCNKPKHLTSVIQINFSSPKLRIRVFFVLEGSELHALLCLTSPKIDQNSLPLMNIRIGMFDCVAECPDVFEFFA